MTAPGETNPASGALPAQELGPPLTTERLNDALAGVEMAIRLGGAALSARAAFEGDEEAARLLGLHRETLDNYRAVATMAILGYEVSTGNPTALKEMIDPARDLSPFARRFWQEVDASNHTQESLSRRFGWSASRVTRVKQGKSPTTREEAVIAARFFSNSRPEEEREEFVRAFMTDWEVSQGYHPKRRTRIEIKEPDTDAEGSAQG